MPNKNPVNPPNGIPATTGVKPSRVCHMGYHLMSDNKCHPNTAYCVDKKYDVDTFNCYECKWYAFQVQGDMTHFPWTTGDYCRTRWWAFVLWLFLALTGLLLFLGA